MSISDKLISYIATTISIAILILVVVPLEIVKKKGKKEIEK